jgi:hypothetical protein
MLNYAKPLRTTTQTGSQVTTTTVARGTATTIKVTTPTLNMPTTTTIVSSSVSTDSGCVDTDGGKNYFLKGNTHGVNGDKNDMCLSTKKLKEYYCDMGRVLSMTVVCKIGCRAGACWGENNTFVSSSNVTTTTVETTSTTIASTVSSTATTLARTTTTLAKAAGTGLCVDSDGGKTYDQKGVANGLGGRKVDKCKSPTILEEAYCDGDRASVEDHRCEKGCVAGICR